jgi:transcriptional antiterminator RfaH
MPLLASKNQLYPADILSRKPAEDDHWWVLHTKPRCEKALARILMQERISCFLPLGQTKRKYQRRWVISQVPLFPGYVFLKGNEDSRLTALQTNKVVATLNVENQIQLQSELNDLYHVISSGHDVQPESGIKEGNRVEVAHGVLVGLRGIVSRCDGHSRIFIEVNMLGRGVSVQVEDWMLQKI